MNKKQALIQSLLPYITENKYTKMQEVLAHRTRYVTVVLEDIFQPHNASAVLRTADIFGIQQVHVIQERYQFKPIASVAMGSAKWVDTSTHASTIDAYKELKKSGYTIVATTPHTTSYELPELPLDKKIALVFGSEQTGLSQAALENADLFVKIPMYGFVESFNISVSVALCLYDIITRLNKSDILWHLSPEEKENLLLQWIAKSSTTAKQLIKNSLI